MFNNYLVINNSKISGQGTFTTVDIPKNKPIVEITGLLTKDYNIVNDNPGDYLQISHDWFLGPSGKNFDFINHSCDPNCYLYIVGTRVILYSLYVIKANTELTFDYSTTSEDNHDTWFMNCSCNSFKCRKKISGYQYLNDDIKKDYMSKNILPLFMINNSIKG